VNFFTHQDQARKNTRKLVVLFLCAIVTLILITSFLVIGILFYADSSGDMGLNREFLSSKIFIQVSIGVIAVVGIGTLYRLAQLSGGGKVVAESMGGRLLNTGTRDADERKILNVVEEMAIASGTPVPPVYLMEDESINAFAAGYKATDAVIGVTRGCIRELSRDELQGVIAHEFSHIFNGDMRLNIRLMGILYGIMVIGLVGYHILRGGRYSAVRSRGKGGGGGIVFLGLGLLVIGYGGAFFGNLSKAAVSRQREFLADASAVQYTRNPDGIGGALKKIGGYGAGTVIGSKDASEISHMLFCSGIKSGLSGLFATHPPLDERIRRIDPDWHGQSRRKSSAPRSGQAAAGVSNLSDTGSVLDAVGSPGEAHIRQAAATLEAMPAKLREEAHHSMSACLMMHGLLLALAEDTSREKQLGLLEAQLDEKDFRALQPIMAEIGSTPRDKYLVLVDLALPSLKQLSRIQLHQFLSTLHKQILVDQDLSLFEWCLFKILRYSLDEKPGRRQRALPISSLVNECTNILTILAIAGNPDEGSARDAFNRARNVLDLGPIAFRESLGVDTGALEQAFDQLNVLQPLHKPRLLKAMVTCINADGHVSPEEGELLRAAGTLLDCPIPPLLPGQRFI